MSESKKPDMPDDALVVALGTALLSGAKTKHMEVLAGEVSYLRTQLNVLANTFDPDGSEGIKEYVKDVHKISDKSLLKILE